MSFLDMSIMAAVMIIFIIIIRKFLINKIPHQIWGILWLLVIIRLYIPYKIETKFNFYNGIFFVRRILAENDLLNIGYQSYYLDRVMQEISNIPFVKWTLFLIWTIGAVALFRYFCKDYIVAKELRKKSIKTPICEQARSFLREYGLYKDVEILQSDEIDMPLAYGIVHPGILLPAKFGDNSISDMRHMVLHEYMHLKYMHPLLQLVVISILCINWFNPILWVWYHYMSRDMEISCDRHVLDILGMKNREAYAMNLIRMAEVKSRKGAFYSGFSKYVMEERIVAIMKYKKTTMVALVISMLIPTGVASAFGTNDNYVFNDEVKSGEIVITVDEAGAITETKEIFIAYEDLKTYIVGQEERAVSSINIEGYEYTTYNQTPPATLKVSTERYGYTYSGTLRLVDLEINGSRYTGYYSGTLYRQ